MSDWGFVDASSGIDIDCVDHLVGGLRVFLALVLVLVLSRRCEEKTAIGCECQSPEERSQGLICVEARVLHAQAQTQTRTGRMRLW